MKVQIRFTANGANSLIGGFVFGGIARVDAEFARHLVEEAKVAEYTNVVKAEEKPKRKKAKE